MTVVVTEFSYEAPLAACLGVTRDESIAMERQLETMFAEMNVLHARNAAIDLEIGELARETKVALNQLMTALKLL